MPKTPHVIPLKQVKVWGQMETRTRLFDSKGAAFDVIVSASAVETSSILKGATLLSGGTWAIGILNPLELRPRAPLRRYA